MALLFWFFSFVISTLALPQNSSADLQSTWMSSHSCTFNYQATMTNITFHNCTTLSGSYVSWYTCTLKCCNGLRDIDYIHPTIDAINECQNNTLSDGSNVPIIIMGVLVAIFGIIVFICFCSVTCRLIRSFRAANHIGPDEEEFESVEWEEETQLNNKIEQLVWSSNFQKKRSLEIIDTPCSICLEDNTTAELFCKHQYHPICIGSWLRKGYVCPFCRRDNIQGIKVYCQECRLRYLVCTRTLMRKDADKLPTICGSCTNAKLLVQLDVELPVSSDFIFDHEASNEKIIQNEGEYVFAMEHIP